jgi:chaperonin GroEL
MRFHTACTMVFKLGLQNAAGIAGLLMATEALVTELPEKEATTPMPGSGGMGSV